MMDRSRYRVSQIARTDENTAKWAVYDREHDDRLIGYIVSEPAIEYRRRESIFGTQGTPYVSGTMYRPLTPDRQSVVDGWDSYQRGALNDLVRWYETGETPDG